MPRVVDDLEVEAVFAAGGPLQHLLRGYQPRRAQIDMALQVARALHTPRARLVVEAGTGTGKSFAYLVPALLGEGRVVVATGTKALQDQLVDKDAPIAVRAVAELRGEVQAGAPHDKPTQTVMRMKGRNNYLCKLRYERFDRQQHFGSLATQSGQHSGFADDVLVQIGRFAATTKTGDRAELVNLPDQLNVWSEIDADKDHCLFQQCPVYDSCHVVEMRRQAEKASVIVVNHHLLCADQRIKLDTAGFGDSDQGGVLPSFDALIVDEAHALPDVATDHFGLQTGSEVIGRLLLDVRKNADACAGDDRAALLDRVDDVDAAATALFLALGGVKGGGREGGPRGEQKRAERSLFQASEQSAGLSTSAGTALKDLSNALDAARARKLPGASSDGDNGAHNDLEAGMHKATLDALFRRSERTRAELSYLTGAAATDDRFVLFIDHGARGTSITAAPIDVSSPLSGTLFAHDTPVVLTSATLAVGTDVHPFLFQVGLAAPIDVGGPDEAGAASDDADDDSGAARAVDVVTSGIYPSPFDHKERAALYCPVDMPEPNDAGYGRHFDDELAFLLGLSKGGALLLFTSHRAMDDAFVRMQPVLQALAIPALKQGERPKSVLLDELRNSGGSSGGHPQTPGAALFATSSFWEGVDVRGAALRLVVIDRLPFRVPSDPLVRARGEHARSRGKDPFHDVAVAEAALALKQGAGRLLRTVDDAGVVAVLDGRLRKRPYGKVFLAALPPMTRVGARKTLAQFWTRFVEPQLGLPSTSTLPPDSSPPPGPSIVAGTSSGGSS